ENLAFHLDRDLARQVAAGDGGRDLGDIADLRGQIARHRVDAVGEVLPGAGDAGHIGLAAEPAVGTHLASNARHVARIRREADGHGVVRFVDLQNFAFDVDGDFLGEVAAGDGGRDFGDVADLRRQIARHEVDAVGEVLPGAGNAGHTGLTAELAFGADLASN